MADKWGLSPFVRPVPLSIDRRKFSCESPKACLHPLISSNDVRGDVEVKLSTICNLISKTVGYTGDTLIATMITTKNNNSERN